jgi:hypothetical protein
MNRHGIYWHKLCLLICKRHVLIGHTIGQEFDLFGEGAINFFLADFLPGKSHSFIIQVGNDSFNIISKLSLIILICKHIRLFVSPDIQYMLRVN